MCDDDQIGVWNEVYERNKNIFSRKYFGDLVMQDGRANLPVFENDKGKLNEE